MDGPGLLGLHRALAVDGLAQDVEHPAQHALAHRDGDGGAGGGDLHAPAQALAGGEHDAAHRVAAHVLGHLHHLASAVQLHLQGLLDLRQAAGAKATSTTGPMTCTMVPLFSLISNPLSGMVQLPSAGRRSAGPPGGALYSAAWAPPTTSVISWVMAACRARL